MSKGVNGGQWSNLNPKEGSLTAAPLPFFFFLDKLKEKQRKRERETSKGLTSFCSFPSKKTSKEVS